MAIKTRDWKQIADDKEKYQAYLCSREWAERREAVRERSSNRCERCRVLPMDACHHLTYERKYNEHLEDLQAICNPCHAFTHGKSDVDPYKMRFVLRYLLDCDANGLKAVPSSWLMGLANPESECEELAARCCVIEHLNGMSYFNKAFESICWDIQCALIDFEYVGWLRKGKPTYEVYDLWDGGTVQEIIDSVCRCFNPPELPEED